MTMILLIYKLDLRRKATSKTENNMIFSTLSLEFLPEKPSRVSSLVILTKTV